MLVNTVYRAHQCSCALFVESVDIQEACVKYVNVACADHLVLPGHSLPADLECRGLSMHMQTERAQQVKQHDTLTPFMTAYVCM